MLCVSAAGDSGLALFVLKGKRYAYRYVRCASQGRVEKRASCLPKNSLLCLREDVAEVNSDNFYKGAKHLVKHVQHLNQSGRKLLLRFDGYCLHMIVRVLNLFQTNGIIA